MTRAGCPICRAHAELIPIEAYGGITLVKCSQCTTFTISRERFGAFAAAWDNGDREQLMCLESLSRYLRCSTDDEDRHVTSDNWRTLAIEGQTFEWSD